jgi:PAS domain S-box-containing protein
VKLKYDSYELEIIISLGILLLFLISINFISGYSFEYARRAQIALFEKNLALAADFAASHLENILGKLEHTAPLDEQDLHSLAIRTGIDNIALLDTLGQVTASTRAPASHDIESNEVVVERPLTTITGRPAGRVRLQTPNITAQQLSRLSNWDTIFRILGLTASLLISALFLKAILLPYRRIKHEALDFNLDIAESGPRSGIEYIVTTFKNLILELEDKRSQLESMYKSSQRRADSLARYNEYILGSITSGVIICDSKGLITRFNPSAKNVLQFLETGCLGKHFGNVFGKIEKLVALFDDAVHHGKTHSRLEIEIDRPQGGRVWLGCSSSLINDERGGGMGAVVLLIDLTEIRRLQEQASYSQKMAALGETAAGLAHEVRNSFAAILGFANLLKKLGGRDPEIIKMIDAIKTESSGAETLMSRFLSFAKPLDIHPAMIDIREIINTSLNFIPRARLETTKVIKEIEHGLPEFLADGALLKQALSNLIINACEALSDGGEIMIRAYLQEPTSKYGPREIIISVADNGSGLSSEIADKIFDPFVSGKPDGIGLGLALTKKIVVLHEGRIEVHSKPGKGTRFTIYLPLRLSESMAVGAI